MVIKVLVEISSLNLDKCFNYLVPKSFQDKIKVGIRVLVPFSNQTLEGFVLDILNENDIDMELKEIIDVIDEDVILTNELRDLGKYISETTLSTLISAYQVMLPKALKAQKKTKINIKKDCYIEINNLAMEKLNKNQLEIIDLLKDKKRILYKELKEINSSVDSLLDRKIVKRIYIEKYRLLHENKNLEPKKILTNDQRIVSDEVIKNLNKEEVYLLHGITGSGKTEVYMEIIEEVIRGGKEALLLVPEITLTSQIYERFSKRFKDIAILHSGLSDGEKYDEYRRIRNNEVKIVIGARSAIFAPLNNIGIIIIDECHTTSYKQENNPKYDAIKVAMERIKTHSCPLILGSATPSLETYARAQKGLYKLLTLPKRIGTSTLPKILIADMTKETRIKNTSISKLLYEKINDRLEKKEQIILLINRRGYSTSLMCKNCGNIIKCPNCDINLTYHKTKDILRCHYCGYATNRPKICPKCQSDSLRELGSGTEKIEEELKLLFEAKIIRMDYDTTTKKGSHERIISDFANHKYDILLGTQMIAKGLDFSNVTLVGVINADTSLFIPNYLSSETTFQLLSQVSGRSGRSEKKGEVVIQTYNVDHYAIKDACNNDYMKFYREEMLIRLKSQYPPYYNLVYLVIKGKDYSILSKEVNRIGELLKQKLPDLIILGPSICNPFKKNNVYHFSIMIKYKKEDIYPILKELLNHYKVNNKVTIDVSFNPNNM